MVFLMFSVLFFLIVLFPYSDLTSFSKEKINQNIKSSGSSVDYSKISLNLFPFGVQTSDIEINSRSLNSILKAGSITLRPDFLSLIQFKLGGTAVLSNLFSGNADISAALDGKTEENTQKFSARAALDKLSLEEIAAFQRLPLKLKGFLSGDLFIKGEESFRTQPEGNFKLNMSNVVIPSAIPIPKMGDFPLPKKIKWENSNLFGKIEKGKVTVTKGTLGTKKAPVNGRYKGYINCSTSKSGTKMSNVCTNYDFKIELELDAEFQREVASSLQAFIKPDQVKITKLPQGGARYTFSVQGDASNSRRAPRVRSLSSFE